MMSDQPDPNLSSLLMVVCDDATVISPSFDELSDDDDLGRVSKTGERFPSLGVAKWIASIHITTNSFYIRGACDDLYIYAWGYAWFPWLFVMSGFLLTHARLMLPANNEADEGTVVKLVLTRLAKVMPLYAVAMLLSVLIRIMEGRMLPHLWILITQFVLAQVMRASKHGSLPTRMHPTRTNRSLTLTPVTPAKKRMDRPGRRD